MMWNLMRLAAMASSLWCSGCSRDPAEAGPRELGAAVSLAHRAVVGDWAGWMYLRQGGDVPLRFHIDGSDDGLRGAVRMPHRQGPPIPMKRIDASETTLALQRTDAYGRAERFECRLDGERCTGLMTIDGQPNAEFDVTRSAVPLPTIDPKSSERYVGAYRIAPDRAIVVTRWFWGELRASDLKTGRSATLFATSPTEFFAGPAQYVPSPIEVRVSFVPSPDGMEMVWFEGDGEPLSGKRITFREEPVEFVSDDAVLKGTLIKPPGDGPFPVIVMLGGSSWTSRESTRAQGTDFAAMGMAALVYDKRGHGESTGDQTVPFATTARDAIAAVKALHGRGDIRSDQIGLFGVSRGGWHAPLAASMSNDVKFVIIFVPPAVSPAAQETTRRLNVLRADGVNEEDIAEARAYLDLQFGYAKTGERWNEYLAARNRIEARGWLDTLEGPDTPDRDGAWRWAAMNMHYDPIPVLERVTCPVLALFGERDPNVTPEQNLEPMRAALARAGNHDVTLHVVPGSDHGLGPVGEDGQPLPLHRVRGSHPDRWAVPREWLAKHVSLVAP